VFRADNRVVLTYLPAAADGSGVTEESGEEPAGQPGDDEEAA
jgi:hypothetical protein